MIDLTSLAAPMGAFPSAEPSSLAGGEAAALATDKTSTVASPGQAQPSAAGFLQVLELFLGSTPLPSSLLGATSITQTGTGEISLALDGQELEAPSIDTTDGAPLDEQTSERIASLLQMLGFQVKPTDIQELSNLDREQLANALEFVQRNLERGADPTQVAENAALLLPRDWPLDDADGSPVGTGKATTATEAKHALPTDQIAELAALREKLEAEPAPASPNHGAKADADIVTNAPHGGNAGTEQKSSNRREHPADAGKLAELAAALWKETAPRETANGAPETSALPRHLPPGGTTSELIGRQVLEKVHLQLSEGQREIKLRLWPEELGEVRLALRMNDNDKVHASLVVENDAVRQAILDATPQLKDALNRHGLDLERLSVSVSQRDAQQASDEGQGGQRKGSRGAGRGGGWSEAEVRVPETVALGEDTGLRNGRNTIDLWS